MVEFYSSEELPGQFQPNALTKYLPKMDLIGPTVNDDIRRAIWRYGADAVKEAIKEETKVKRGRKNEPDWPELRDLIEEDARDWLAGKDPFTARSNYATAKLFAERNPGHSIISTHKRIERKLSTGPYDRRWFTFGSAASQSLSAYPFETHLRALQALSELPSRTKPEVWETALKRARATVAEYEAREGHAPRADMTFSEIENAVRLSNLTVLAPTLRQGRPSLKGATTANSLGLTLRQVIEGLDD